jgi:RHS repeat-associated protein
MDNVYDRISVILDGKLVFESVPRLPMAYFSPALSFVVGTGNVNEVEIDDVSVSAFYSLEDKNHLITLFKDDFPRLNDKNSVENSGWRTKGERVLESDQEESELKTLSIKADEGEQVTVAKTFNVPVDFPFDISDKTFEIRYNDSMYSESAAYDDAFTGHGGHGPSLPNFYSSPSNTLSNSTPGRSRTSELINTYYIYTFDGKLLAEYDHNGNCVRDYIYAGNRLIAEYKPQTGEYFYYMNDQINSTRIITNDSGNVVFSEAYGPYGDVQKTWTNTYDPKLKFSGKEREGYSGLDYFGARYYDHKSFRFNSVDPVITRDKALSDPQLWNLYVYCRNNPITFLDPDGRELRTTQIKTMQEIAGPAASSIKIAAGKLDVSGLSQSAMSNNEGATLLYELATSNYVYTYSEGPTGGVSNLDNKPDWRFPNGKSSKFLPPPGVDCAVGIDPSIKYIDAATGTLNVSSAAIAFHELAEAYGKVDLGKPYVQKGGGAGAHEYARQREKTLNKQRPGFTQHPAGETLKKK